MSVSVVDYGLGNLGSVANMLKRVGVPNNRVTSSEEILTAERILLPGVGAFDRGTALLRDAKLIDALRQFAASGRPLLGICLGMQLLLDSSEEGVSEGLGLIPGRSRRFEEAPGLRVPHMGWNGVIPRRDDPLFASLPDDNRFYFVHSYRVVPEREDDVLAGTTYGAPFASMIRRDNVMGAQFHPEKSHTFGMVVLRNFAQI